MRNFLTLSAIVVGLALNSTTAHALPLPLAIAAPRDVPYPGQISLSVDATDLERRIFTVRETIPVAGPGPMVLLYPSWIPGKHQAFGARH